MTQAAPSRLTAPVSDRDHVRGPAAAPITLVEYGDFECPYCRALAPIVDELRQRLGDQLRFVFRHFPRPSHRHAFHAAGAAEAAAAQGKFWEMHDLLYARRQSLDDEHLRTYAAKLGLDVERFTRELRDDEVYAERVREDLRTGIESGADGTPTLYLDGIRFDTTVGLQELLTAISRAHPEVAVEAPSDSTPERRRIPRVRRLQPARS